MSEPIRSTRPLGETTTTRLFLTDEDQTQIQQADIDHIDVLAFRGNERDPFWEELAIDPAADDAVATVYDTLQTSETWTASTGFNFRSRIMYGGDFQPRAGETVTIEFLFSLVNGDLIVVRHLATYSETLGLQFVL